MGGSMEVGVESCYSQVMVLCLKNRLAMGGNMAMNGAILNKSATS